MQRIEASCEAIDQLLAQSKECEEKGELKTAIAYAQQAFATVQEANAVALLPEIQSRLAGLYVDAGQHDAARANALAVLELAPESVHAAGARIVLGVVFARDSDYETAESQFHLAIERCRALNDQHCLARALHNLASSVYWPRGLFDLALAVMAEAQHFHNQPDRRHWGMPYLQAMIYEQTGDLRRARLALDELLPMLRPADRLTGGYFYLWARVALAEGEFARAEEYLHLLMRIATATGAADLNIWARTEQARFQRLKGDAAAGLAWAEDGLKYARRVGYDRLAGHALLELAQCTWLLQDHAAAHASLAEALQIFEQRSAMYDLAVCLFLEAVWAQQENRPDAEAVWLKASVAVVRGGYGFLLEREREAAFPLVAFFLRSRSAPARRVAEALLSSLERVAPPLLKIHGLGGFAVWQGRRQIPAGAWQRRKAGELFRFLTLRPNFSAGREAILEALWPDNNPQAALDMLHQATSTLRHILEPDLPDKFPSRYLLVEGEQVTLLLPEGSQVDFLEFEQQLGDAMQSCRHERLQVALQMYRGDLFPSDQYADWSALHRERLSQLYQRGLQIVGQVYLELGLFFDALNCSQAILHRDPWSEDAVALGMRAALGLHDAPRAMRMYLGLEKTLKQELGLAPRADLRELAESLK
jgi:DNA-binding SARP family transcriptional activator